MYFNIAVGSMSALINCIYYIKSKANAADMNREKKQKTVDAFVLFFFMLAGCNFKQTGANRIWYHCLVCV